MKVECTKVENSTVDYTLEECTQVVYTMGENTSKKVVCNSVANKREENTNMAVEYTLEGYMRELLHNRIDPEFRVDTRTLTPRLTTSS